MDGWGSAFSVESTAVSKIKKKSDCDCMILGTTVLGERGQLVIPAKAREHFKLKRGEEFVVMKGGPQQDLLTLIPTQKMNELLAKFSEISSELSNFSKANINSNTSVKKRQG